MVLLSMRWPFPIKALIIIVVPGFFVDLPPQKTPAALHKTTKMEAERIERSTTVRMYEVLRMYFYCFRSATLRGYSFNFSLPD
jgi:hypothetical protein